MAVTSLALERRILALEKRLPVLFSWAQGQTQPPVGSHGFTFWEDTKEDNAKLLMRRGLKVFIFQSYEAGSPPPIIEPATAIPTNVSLAAGAVGVATGKYALEDHRHALVPSALALTVRHLVYVADADGKAKTGATLSTALHYDDGTLHAASETVAVTEIGSGDYRVSFVPTVRGAVYRLRVTSSTDIVTPGEFQDLIWSA
jgi:hypothetical protein